MGVGLKKRIEKALESEKGSLSILGRGRKKGLKGRVMGCFKRMILSL